MPGFENGVAKMHGKFLESPYKNVWSDIWVFSQWGCSFATTKKNLGENFHRQQNDGGDGFHKISKF